MCAEALETFQIKTNFRIFLEEKVEENKNPLKGNFWERVGTALRRLSQMNAYEAEFNTEYSVVYFQKYSLMLKTRFVCKYCMAKAN